MAQSKLKKTVAAAALSGLMIGAAGYVVGCSHHDKDDAGMHADSSAAGVQHACKGMNACKGQGGCKTSDNGCKGKNSCKGKGGCKTM
jgi:hypothetical protein